MRKVNKNFDEVPEKLKECFSQKEVKLLEQKERHSFDARCYNNAIIEELKTLYKNKCAYCESFFLSKVTVEHYRPKNNGYYWLAYEWSNLIPTCEHCNNSKGNKFEIAGKKVKTPKLTPDGKLDLEHCKATCPDLLNEKALIIHPEIDEPKDFFYFDSNGEIKAKDNDSKAKKTIEIVKLNDESLLLKRKKLIDDLFFDCDIASQQFLEYLDETKNVHTEKELKLVFFPFFKKLTKLQSEEVEFTLLCSELLERFDYFFLDKIEKSYSKELKELLVTAFQLFDASIL